MRILLDNNLSWKLCKQITGTFQEINHVKLLGLDTATDKEIWDYYVSLLRK